MADNQVVHITATTGEFYRDEVGKKIKILTMANS